MSAIGYTLTYLASVPTSLRLTALDDPPRDLRVEHPTLTAAATAILRDYTGRDYGLGDAIAFVAFALGGLDQRTTLAITIKGSVVARFLDAAGRTTSLHPHGRNQ